VLSQIEKASTSWVVLIIHIQDDHFY